MGPKGDRHMIHEPSQHDTNAEHFLSRIVGYKEYFLRAKPRGEVEKKF